MVSLMVKYFLVGSYLLCNIHAFREANARTSVDIGSDGSFPPALNRTLNRTLTTATLALPTREALNVFDWVDFLFKSRILVESQSRNYWTPDKEERVSRDILKKLNDKLGIPETTKIIVRVISGAAAFILGYITREKWSDLDIWIRGIRTMKEINLVESFAKGMNKSLDEDIHNMKWRGANDIQHGIVGGEKKLGPYEPTTDEHTCILRFQKATGNNCDVNSCKEIDAWDPVVEPGKLITKELYNYWWMIHSENPEEGALLELSEYAFWPNGQTKDSHLFDIYIEGYAAQLAFKVAMMSGARQENYDWNRRYLSENCGERDVDPILVKNTDVSDLAHAFMRLVQEKKNIVMWNNWVAHARTKEYSETSKGYQEYWLKLYEADQPEYQEYWSNLARWLKLYRPSKLGQEYWFQYKPKKEHAPFAQVPAIWFNKVIEQELSARHAGTMHSPFYEEMHDKELFNVERWAFSEETRNYLEIVEVDPKTGKGGNKKLAAAAGIEKVIETKRVESQVAHPKQRSAAWKAFKPIWKGAKAAFSRQ